MIEDRDFLMRQIKQMIQNLGKILDRNTLRELLALSEDDMSNEELDSFYLMGQVDIIAAEKQLTPQHLSVDLGIDIDRLEDLFKGQAFLTEPEATNVQSFLETQDNSEPT